MKGTLLIQSHLTTDFAVLTVSLVGFGRNNLVIACHSLPRRPQHTCNVDWTQVDGTYGRHGGFISLFDSTRTSVVNHQLNGIGGEMVPALILSSSSFNGMVAYLACGPLLHELTSILCISSNKVGTTCGTTTPS